MLEYGFIKRRIIFIFLNVCLFKSTACEVSGMVWAHQNRFNHATGLPLFQYGSVPVQSRELYMQLTYLYVCLCFLFTSCRVVHGAWLLCFNQVQLIRLQLFFLFLL